MEKNLTENGFFRLGVASPELKVADTEFNSREIIRCIDKAVESGCRFILFPELSVTAYTCADLFFQTSLLNSALKSLETIAAHTAMTMTTVVVGLPVRDGGRLYNSAAVVSCGQIKGIVPKTYLPNNNEYYEERWFSSEFDRTNETIDINGQEVPFGADLLFSVEDNPMCLIGIEICEDLWSVIPPSFGMSAAGATILLNLSASNELLGKSAYRRQLVLSQSARCLSAYAYASAGPGESSTDMAFSGHSMIAEYGIMLAETERFRFDSQMAFADIDIDRLNLERLKNNTYAASMIDRAYRVIPVQVPELVDDRVLRQIPAMPFVPSDKGRRAESCREIFSIQSSGLATRLRHINTGNVVIGLSGGLDSTLALLVAVRAFRNLGLDPKGIHAITMPGFGTTKRTKNNAARLAALLGLDLRTVPIGEAVKKHFEDIGHDPDKHDIVYENAQARERTQILMDISNQVNGIVVGTGDLSEYALGWCTYNADHISMYGVNSGIPKTLVRYLIDWCAEEEFSGEVSTVLADISSTPISPELLPPDASGQISQETEKTIGPYVLHDFFLYYCIRLHYSPGKVFLLACQAFEGTYTAEEIKKWMRYFYKRFFANQFKRSCFPDGIKVGTVSLSPRGDWRMPSDASAAAWISEVERL